jgi:hypothetical protein
MASTLLVTSRGKSIDRLVLDQPLVCGEMFFALRTTPSLSINTFPVIRAAIPTFNKSWICA